MAKYNKDNNVYIRELKNGNFVIFDSSGQLRSKEFIVKCSAEQYIKDNHPWIYSGFVPYKKDL